jgi:hypothetical protein
MPPRMYQPTRSVTASFMSAPLRTRQIVSSWVPDAEDSAPPTASVTAGTVRHHTGVGGEVIPVAGMMPLTRRPKADI